MTQTADQERQAPIKMHPGGDLHLTMLMASHGLNFVTGKDREQLLAWGRDVWQAASDRLVLGSEPVALLWQHAITGEQFVNLKNQNVPAEPNLFLVGLLCLATVASVPTESTPDPRVAADADKACSLHP